MFWRNNCLILRINWVISEKPQKISEAIGKKDASALLDTIRGIEGVIRVIPHTILKTTKENYCNLLAVSNFSSL